MMEILMIEIIQLKKSYSKQCNIEIKCYKFINGCIIVHVCLTVVV